MRRKASALNDLKRFDAARAVSLECLAICEQLFGRAEGYVNVLMTLAETSFGESNYEKGLQVVKTARSLCPKEDCSLLSNILNLQANFLMALNRYPETLEIRIEAMSLCRRLCGSDHPDFATSLQNAAILYARLKQTEKAVELASEAVAIYTKFLGTSHPSTMRTQMYLTEFKRALTDPTAKKQLASKSDRVCNVTGCNKVEKNMSRCMRCLSFYLCKKHERKINEHVSVCPKFPDVLPDEKKIDKIVKCRRCRKESKLMKCGNCGSVWYCGATCQKEDWKRHKVFCGKKK